MKKNFVFNGLCLPALTCAFMLLIGFSSVNAQMGLPQGWENEDSIRFGLFGIYDAAAPYWGIDGRLLNQANTISDSVGANFSEQWGGFVFETPLSGHIKGYMTYGILSRDTFEFPGLPTITDFTRLGLHIQQRIYYADSTPFLLQWDSSYLWRYNDLKFNPYARVHNNRYDSNDVSSYVEYPRNDSIAALTYPTKRFNSIDSTVSVGNEGRVILGYSENRRAMELLRVSDTTDSFPGIPCHHPRLFSATLEFNIDKDNINTSGGYTSHDSLPLLRFQILFKQGDVKDSTGQTIDAGWSILPFVPFKTKSDSTKAGWFKVIDTTITYSIYNSLDSSWRVPDSTESGHPAHTWNFKQLHVLLKDMPNSMKDLIQPVSDADLRFLYGTGTSTPAISALQNPDSVVRYNTPKNDSTKALFLLESRVLSSYRATVRVRSMTWQDTVVDKFLYRKRYTADSTHSLNPDGSYGGYDSLLTLNIKAFHDTCEAHDPGKHHEILYNDMSTPRLSALACSGLAYLDYKLSKFGIHVHAREQDWTGSQTQQFRRERLGYDGKPPSMYENQENIFYSNYGNTNPTPTDIFPKDYVANAITAADSSPWLSASQDTSVGLIIGRPDLSSGADTLKAYKIYTNIFGGLNLEPYPYKPFIPILRASTRYALSHPKSKRFSIESAIQGWGIFFRNNENTSLFSPHYVARPTTPEETQGMIYAALANGVTSFNNAQAFDASWYANDGLLSGAPGLAGFGPIDSITVPLVHNYNFGHRYCGQVTNYPSSGKNELDSGIAQYYIGYSNSFRVFKRAFSRINQIYDTNAYMKNYPFKQMTWLNAYSTNKSLSASTDKSDTAAYKTAFLKCIRTTPVKRWSRTSANGYQQYIDSTDGSGNLIVDSAHRTYVEVGLFRNNPNDTLKGYAAMVVNTRLWPSLRDAEDSIYYNQGLDSAKDRSKSSLGDIDTRKAWFKIDTTFFPPNFRSNYYVIRDLWHQDTTYLVHRDSAFGVYLKPSEARLLYIEKDVSIRTAPRAATSSEEFAFNNGRRVAEILGGRQSVVTYVRNGNLYVNYPGAGERFEGYNERSAGENIATGYEICLDSSGMCHRPSISAGPNDTSVAIVYWSSGIGGQIKAAYQKKPHDAWWLTTYTGAPFPDTTWDGTGVTPVLAPYAEVSSNTLQNYKDTLWWVAATYYDSALTKKSGIAALRLQIGSSGISFINDNPIQFFANDGVVNSWERSAFPTMTSRPLTNGWFPVRLAWQNRGMILSNRYKNVNGVVTGVGAAQNISKGLNSGCYNLHPSIATGGLHLTVHTPFGWPFPSTILVDYLYDYVVWECRWFNNAFPWSGPLPNYWPVLRARTELLTAQTPNTWGPFLLFQPKVDSFAYHWPITNAGMKNGHQYFYRGGAGNPYDKKTDAYYDRLRVAWWDWPSDSIEIAHYPSKWKRTRLLERGVYPSLGQSAFPIIQNYSDSSMVPASLAFTGLQSVPGGLNHVRITNGWFPQIASEKKQVLFPGYTIGRDPGNYNCTYIYANGSFGAPRLVTSGGTMRKDWEEGDWQQGTIFGDDWPVTPLTPVEFESDTFMIHAKDSVLIARRVDTVDVQGIRDALYDSSDYFMSKLVLRRMLDSSWVATLDSMVITKSVAVYPGYGLDSTLVKYKYPNGMPDDSVFVSIEILRGNTRDSLFRGFIETLREEDSASVAYKRSSGHDPTVNGRELTKENLTMTINPNPLNLTATVIFTGYEGCDAHIELFDLIGKKVLTLYDKEMEGSSLKLTLDGRILQSGMYLLRAQCGNSVITRKVELVK